MRRAKDKTDPPRSQLTQSNITSGTASTVQDDVSTPRPSTELPLSSEYTSPSKSIRNFFRNRTSTYLIESISEEPELRKQRKWVPADLPSPTRSIALLRPKFGRSKSSVADDPVPENAPAMHYTASEERITTVDDFADTSSSSEGDFASTYAHESSNMTAPHGLDDSDPPVQHFVFKEDLEEPINPIQSSMFKEEFANADNDVNEEGSATMEKAPSLKTIDSGNSAANILHPRAPLTRLHLSLQPHSIDVALANATSMEPPLAARKHESSSSAESLGIQTSNISSPVSTKFIIAGDKIQRMGSIDKKTSKVQRVSTTSDPDDIKYPEPNLSNNPTPMQTPVRQHPSSSNSNSNSSGGRGLDQIDLRRQVSMSSHQIPTPTRTEFNVVPPSAAGRRESASLSSSARQSGLSRPISVGLSDSAASGVPVTNLRFSVPETVALSEQYHLSLINPDETAVKLTTQRESMRLSMSSGELLSKLIPASPNRDARRSYNTELSNLRSSYGDSQRSAVENFTAHVDLTTELPMMLFKVQDKDYDEGRQRWSVYEHRASKEGVLQDNAVSRAAATEPQSAQFISHKQESSGSSSDVPFEVQINRPKIPEHERPQFTHEAGLVNSDGAFASPRRPGRDQPQTHEGEIPQYQTNRHVERSPYGSRSNSPRMESNADAHAETHSREQGEESLIYYEPSSTIPISGPPPLHPPEPVAQLERTSPIDHSQYMDSRHEKPRSVRALHSQNTLSPPATAYMLTGHEQVREDPNDRINAQPFDLEKQISGLRKNNAGLESTGVTHLDHLTLHFGAMMVLGLVVPPLYFLLAWGMFDLSFGSNQQYYTGLRYYLRLHDGKILVKRYSRTQKIVSLVVGTLWVLIICAMIGVGFGVGLR